MVIALVGRPNVGKSTLFNRLIGQRKAVVSSTRGTTRDRLCASLQWRGVSIDLMDMGGVDLARTSGLDAAVQAHVQRALQEAEGFLFVCDAQEGLVPADELILERLRKTNKPIVLAANKADHRLVVPPEFFALGVTPACAVSAVHGRGTGELLDALLERFTPAGAQDPSSQDGSDVEADTPFIPTVAIIGRQNVGKSSLLNAWLREERVIVSDLPGTTRDAVETRLMVGQSPIRLIDTAGLRHRRKVKDPIDHFSMSRAVEVIERCDVVLVVLDATQGITRDDQRIIARVCEAGRGCVLVVNKWDLVVGGRLRALPDAVRSKIPAGLSAPVVAVSAKTGFQVFDVLKTALRVHRMMRSGLKDEVVQALLARAWAAHRPPRYRGRVVQLRGACWLSGRPNRLELRLRPVAWLPSSYQHYLLRQVQSLPALSGIPIALLLRGPESP